MPKSATTVLTAPPSQSEFIVHRDPSAKPDSHNRIRFVAYWYDGKTPGEGGPPDHTRGQVFHADLEELARRADDDDMTVRYVDDRPEFTARNPIAQGN
jgi:hypothetical protein